MSYDLLVFDPIIAPKNHDDFMQWYEKVIEWPEPHHYDNPDVTTPSLRAWFLDMIENFPPMNGPLAKDDLPADEARLTDYSVGQTAIYAAFAWSKAQFAYDMTIKLAGKHQVGFFDVSSTTCEVYLPTGNAILALAHKNLNF